MRYKLYGLSKSFIAGVLCSLAFGLWACSGETDSPVVVRDTSDLFADVEDAEVDFGTYSIVLPEGTDTFTVDNIAALGGNKCYLALDDDPVDPEIDWDNPVSTGTELEIGEEGLRLVVLDEQSRIVAVWTISLPEVESSSSVTAKVSSSSEKAAGSDKKSSSSGKETPASSSNERPAESSSSEKPVESSSSEEPVSSSGETPESSSSDVPESSSSAEELSSSSVEEKSSSSVAESSSSEREEPQLPGSDFSARNDFWATTSDAMGTEKTAAAITISSEENLAFASGALTVTTREVKGTLGIIPGSWKMAGGFYFAGSYAGSTALDIYQQGYSSGTPSTGCSDITGDMTFGKAFTARPTAFKITYSYNHVANSSTDYPQKSLVYVMLVGNNSKVVATGAISDSESRNMGERLVNLNYGKDPFGLLSGGYPVAKGLVLGTGNEDVVSIHVMLASSAYAHVVCGGTVGSSDKYRGADGASLSVDKLELIY